MNLHTKKAAGHRHFRLWVDHGAPLPPFQSTQYVLMLPNLTPQYTCRTRLDLPWGHLTFRFPFLNPTASLYTGSCKRLLIRTSQQGVILKPAKEGHFLFASIPVEVPQLRWIFCLHPGAANACVVADNGSRECAQLGSQGGRWIGSRHSLGNHRNRQSYIGMGKSGTTSACTLQIIDFDTQREIYHVMMGRTVTILHV